MADKAKLPGPKAGRWMILIGSLVLLVAGLKAAQDFFLPIMLAFFVATVSLPITNWLIRKRFPRSLAVLVTVLVDFSFIVALLLLASTSVAKKWDITVH